MKQLNSGEQIQAVPSVAISERARLFSATQVWALSYDGLYRYGHQMH